MSAALILKLLVTVSHHRLSYQPSAYTFLVVENHKVA
jgi:hypothetical protein